MNSDPSVRPRVSLVTGGTGFLGSHLVAALRERGDEVVVLDTRAGPPVPGVRYVQADLRDAQAVQAACAGVDAVFHSASIVHTKHTQTELVRAVNVGGTEHVLAACRKHRIPRLIYVSSASVVYEGKDIENGDEALPYATRFPAPYAETKCIAEQAVLAQSGTDGLVTCALRPHVVFGPGDQRFIPAILHRAERGQLRFTISPADRLSDFTYVGNVVDALLLADDKLATDAAAVSGRCYFITNGEPMPFWQFVARIVAPLGHRPPRVPMPFWLAYGAATVRETIERLRGGKLNAEEGLSRFAIRYLCTHHYFSHARATRELGYRPRVGVDEGIARTVAALRR